MGFYEELTKKLEGSYKSKFVCKGTKKLIVIFSPTANFKLQKLSFNCSVLFLSDTKLNYYLFKPKTQVKFLIEFVTNQSYEKVVFLGSSKGGFGALLWSNIMHGMVPNIDISCIAFSPQTKLYPFDDSIIFPSYKRVFKRAEKNKTLDFCLKNYGDLNGVLNEGGVSGAIFYSANYTVDKQQADALIAGHFVKIGLPISFHGSIVPLTIKKNCHFSLEKTVAKLYKESLSDQDLATCLPANKNDLYYMLSKVKVPGLLDAIELFE